jgi:hypothetical protein
METTMNSALLLTDRLCDLTEMALQAYTKFEKATVFAATRAIHEDFRQAALPSHAMEKLDGICHAILAAVEYEPAEGRTNPQCIVKARTEISALRELLRGQEAWMQKERLDGRSPVTLQ